MNPYAKILVLDQDGANLGKMDYKEAELIASQQELDLVQVNKDKDDKLLVFKIMDHGKWKYTKKKNQNKSHVRQLKEINFKLSIDPHDQETKISQIKRFLSKNADVKISVQMRGREKSMPEMARNKLDSVLEEIKDLVQVQQIKSSSSLVFATVRPLQG